MSFHPKILPCRDVGFQHLYRAKFGFLRLYGEGQNLQNKKMRIFGPRKEALLLKPYFLYHFYTIHL